MFLKLINETKYTISLVYIKQEGDRMNLGFLKKGVEVKPLHLFCLTGQAQVPSFRAGRLTKQRKRLG